MCWIHTSIYSRISRISNRTIHLLYLQVSTVHFADTTMHWYIICSDCNQNEQIVAKVLHHLVERNSRQNLHTQFTLFDFTRRLNQFVDWLKDSLIFKSFHINLMLSYQYCCEMVCSFADYIVQVCDTLFVAVFGRKIIKNMEPIILRSWIVWNFQRCWLGGGARLNSLTCYSFQLCCVRVCYICSEKSSKEIFFNETLLGMVS